MLKSSVTTRLLVSSFCVKNREKSLRHIAMEAKCANVAAMSISAHTSLFSDEQKSINRGKNQYNFIVAELFEYSPVHDCSFILFFHRSRMQMAVSLKRDC